MLNSVSNRRLVIDPRETMGMRIRRLRTELQLTQEDIAVACDVSKTAVSQWETSPAPNIKLQTFLKLLACLRVGFEELIYGTQPAPVKLQNNRRVV